MKKNKSKGNKKSGKPTNKWRNPNLIIISSLLFLLLLHLPFLKADPDTIADIHTRGAWTDEGLYTGQISNYVTNGNFNIKEDHQFIVTPLFNAVILPFYLLFNKEIITGRIVVLIFLLLAAFLSFRKENLFFTGLFFTAIVLTQYQIFHFSHYSMAEMMCISWILLAFSSINHYFESPNKRLPFIFLSAFFLFCAYSTKISFLNVAWVLPATLACYGLFVSESKKNSILQRFKPFLISLGITFVFMSTYLLVWYLPEKDFYNQVWNSLTEGKFPSDAKHLLQLIKFHWGFTFWVKELIPLILFVALSIIITPYILVSKERKNYLGPFFFLLFWILIELTKVSSSYLPYRYLLGLITAAGLFAAYTLSFIALRNKVFNLLLGIGVTAIFIFNISLIYSSFNRRTNDIKTVNDYLMHYNIENQTILGVWSHTLARGTDATCLTYRESDTNRINPIQTLNPGIVIAEHNESDSDSLFIKQGILLNEISDSVKDFNVWRYKIRLFWLNQSK